MSTTRDILALITLLLLGTGAVGAQSPVSAKRLWTRACELGHKAACEYR